jgi:hypothetical protein
MQRILKLGRAKDNDFQEENYRFCFRPSPYGNRQANCFVLWRRIVVEPEMTGEAHQQATEKLRKAGSEPRPFKTSLKESFFSNLPV